ALQAERAEMDEYHFLVVNDIHYVDKRCGDWLQGVLKQMKEHKEKLDFALIVGDLTHNGKADELTAVRDLFKGLGLPLHVVVGNHDYRTQDDRKAYEEAFPQSLNYRFEHNGWQFVALDTTDGLKYQHVAAPKATLTWLDDNVGKLDRKKPLMVFTHFPLGPDV